VGHKEVYLAGTAAKEERVSRQEGLRIITITEIFVFKYFQMIFFELYELDPERTSELLPNKIVVPQDDCNQQIIVPLTLWQETRRS
jgi:hypothetical protein